MKNKLTIALPKGRFLENCKDLLKHLGIEVGTSRKYSFEAEIDGININIKLLKMVDIPILFKSGMIDITILCDEWIEEYELKYNLIKQLNWCNSKIILATQENFHGPRDIRLATSYPNLAKKYLAKIFNLTDIIEISGSVEAMVPEYADAIFECVETGETLRDNNLIIQETYMNSSVKLICNKSIKLTEHSNLLKLLNSV